MPRTTAGLTRASEAVPASPAVAPTAQAPRDEPPRPAIETGTATASPSPDPTPPEVSEATEAETGVEAAAAATSATPTPGGPKTGGPKKAQDRRDDPGRERPARPPDESGGRAGHHQGPVRRHRSRAGGAVPRLERPGPDLRHPRAARQHHPRARGTGRDQAAGVAPSGSLDRWAAHVRRLRDNFRAIQDELDADPRGARAAQGARRGDPQPGPRLRRACRKGCSTRRMVPIGPLFERFRRVIRDLSLSSGKEVLLQIGGEKTELDKRMIDELSRPADPHGPQRGRPRARARRTSARRRASRAPAPSRSWPRTAATAW